MAPKFAFDHPDDALRSLAERLAVVGISQQVTDCTGRILAEAITADRDSPAADVSAMDGYAIRLADLHSSEPLPVRGESAPGAPPPAIQPSAVVRIFTGAIVPAGCEAVVKREDTEELDDAIRFRQSALSTRSGEHIRRAGENAAAGAAVLSAGTKITAGGRATMANFGHLAADVYAPVRVSIITTGDEVGVFAENPPKPWQLRNSNRASLTALLDGHRFIHLGHVDHCKDDRDSLAQLLAQRLEESDAILMTGGVSMGNYDYVPDVVRGLGGDIIFHGLPLRPGKPILGAASGDGKLILGLPGNPVSATVGCRRMAMPLLARQAGQTEWLTRQATVRLPDADDKTIPLHWLRLARLVDHGSAQLVQSRGSGDLVSLGQSSGFVELPPDASGPGPWPYYPWN
jgi:molybdenum cofactor synthesis domain-containing protein